MKIYIESRCHSPGCMAMQSGKIYLAQNARFSGEFAAGFTGLTPHSRRTRPGWCRKEMLCSTGIRKAIGKAIAFLVASR
ncbi:hypothetical protein RBC57_004681 [Salmonella enterica]|nr:hypothetical protein [Salmonella enterica]